MTETEFRRYLDAKARQAGGKKRLAQLIGEDPGNFKKMIKGARGPSPKVLAYLGMEPAFEFVRLPSRPNED